MVITPNSDVILLKCPLELSSEHQLNFSNATAQYNYFNGLPKLVVGTNFTYVRKDNYLRVPALFDDIIQYNYVMYRNDAYSNKWFYAFIEKMEYVNDRTTYVYIKTDPFQTWQFDLTYKRTFVEREHVNDDTIGLHTVEEGLEYGEYIVGWSKDLDYTSAGTFTSRAPFVAVGVTITPNHLSHINTSTSTLPFVETAINNGIPSGVSYLFVSTSNNNIANLVRLYDQNSKSDAIVSMFVIPTKYFVQTISQYSGGAFTVNMDDGGSFSGFTLEDIEGAIEFMSETVTPPTTVDGYVPKNAKLLCFPYCYERLTNNGGMEATYRWEDFTNRTPVFKVAGSLTQGMSIRAYPQNYLKAGGGTNAYVYGLTAQKLPACCWSTDFYLSWVNQQGANLALQTGVNVGNAILGASVGSAASGNIAGVGAGVVGMGLNVVGTIANTMQKIREAELVPPQARGALNSGDVNFSIGKSGFTIYDMNIKAEYARQIDEFFSAYGYKVNRMKVPNVTGRSNWNFVKTIDCYIQADIPQEDLQEIKNMFNNGLTIWHNASTFLDYSQNNTIV